MGSASYNPDGQSDAAILSLGLLLFHCNGRKLPWGCVPGAGDTSKKNQKELRAWIGLEKKGMKRNMGRLGFFASSLHFHLHVDF